MKGPWYPAPAGTAGLPIRSRAFLLDGYLTAPMWRDAPAGTWTNLNTAERLVLYPICAVRRKVPTSELLAGLSSLNENFAEELRTHLMSGVVGVFGFFGFPVRTFCTS